MGIGSKLKKIGKKFERAVRPVAKFAAVAAATYYTGGAGTGLAQSLVYKSKAAPQEIGGEPLPMAYSAPFNPGFSYGGYSSAGNSVSGGGIALGGDGSGPAPVPIWKNPFFLIGGGLLLFFGSILLIRR